MSQTYDLYIIYIVDIRNIYNFFYKWSRIKTFRVKVFFILILTGSQKTNFIILKSLNVSVLYNIQKYHHQNNVK